MAGHQLGWFWNSAEVKKITHQRPSLQPDFPGLWDPFLLCQVRAPAWGPKPLWPPLPGKTIKAALFCFTQSPVSILLFGSSEWRLGFGLSSDHDFPSPRTLGAYSEGNSLRSNRVTISRVTINASQDLPWQSLRESLRWAIWFQSYSYLQNEWVPWGNVYKILCIWRSKTKDFRISGFSRWEKKVESEPAEEKIVLY